MGDSAEAEEERDLDGGEAVAAEGDGSEPENRDDGGVGEALEGDETPEEKSKCHTGLVEEFPC